MSGNVMVRNLCVLSTRRWPVHRSLVERFVPSCVTFVVSTLLTDDISFHSFFLMRTPNTVRAKSLLLQIRQQNSIRVGYRQSGERNVVPGGDGAGLLGRLHGG